MTEEKESIQKKKSSRKFRIPRDSTPDPISMGKIESVPCGDAGRTAEMFVPSPFNEGEGNRLERNSLSGKCWTCP
jgi:hypothetical protein